MGGDTKSRARITREASRELESDWLQWLLDFMGHHYGYSKEQIFAMFPHEIELMQKWAQQRMARENESRLFDMLIAARAPHTKDGGDSIITALRAKYYTFNDGSDVTDESMQRDFERAKRLLGQ